MNYLFMFTIGPVKSFIENSRKARDLYAGSKLLSELMQEAVCRLKRERGITVLFPFNSTKSELPNMPNRLVAEFKGYSTSQLKEAAEKLSIFIRETFLQNSLALLKKIGMKEDGVSMAENQLNQFLEIYWLFERFENEKYSTVYQNLFTAVHDIKSVRCFQQTKEPWGRKCMLFPEYNAIFAKKHIENGKEVFPYHTNSDYIYDISDHTFLQYDVKPNEALSAIALVKRAYDRPESRIYSTRQMLLKSRISQNVFQEAGIPESDEKWMDHIANVVYDLDNGTTWMDDTYPLEAVEHAEQLYKLIQEYNIPLSSYYGLIKFDGDSMGDAFRELNKIEEHKNLSKKISQFADKAPSILLKYGGLPVFAGGEDFMGFLPLDTLFDCLKELHREFLTIIGLTFSAGVSIAHLMHPLKEVLAQADQMEQIAKKKESKNAFAIGIIKRSGENVRIPAYHFSKAEEQPVLEDMQELIQLLMHSGCSKALFFQIANLLKSFIREDACPSDAMMEVLLTTCMTAAHVDRNLISRADLLQKLLLFFRSAKNGTDFLNTLNSIVFLSREVR